MLGFQVETGQEYSVGKWMRTDVELKAVIRTDSAAAWLASACWLVCSADERDEACTPCPAVSGCHTDQWRHATQQQQQQQRPGQSWSAIRLTVCVSATNEVYDLISQTVWLVKKDLRVCIVSHENPSQNRGASPAIWDHVVFPATRHWWTCPALTPARQTGTPFSFYLPRRDGRLSWAGWLVIV